MPISREKLRNKIRLLDIDDLFLTSMLLACVPPSVAAKQLGLTPPAVSHRIKKLKMVFGEDIFMDVQSKRKLTERGKRIFGLCVQALDLILESEGTKVI